ncbi:MAG: HAMP domain-containing histidine kinase [Candidatus Nitrosotenuis sp.]|nr:HAMP domain-containing histidine kinase [Candidatus Nitrosotenuis sp.]
METKNPVEDPVDQKVESIKKARFNANLKFLQDDVFNKTEFDALGKEFESDKIGQEVSGLLYQYEKQKMVMVQRQIQEEKTLVQELNQKIETNIAKFVNLESRLKQKQGELETEVRIKTQKLIEAERLAAIGELSSRLAHDLKNPLSVLKVITDLLKWTNKDGTDANFVHRLEAANAAIFRMTHQIDNVLDFVKDANLSKEPTTIHEIIKLALSKIPDKTGIALNVQSQDVDLVCDKQKMAVVFSNILLNSMQAMKNSGSISIKFYPKGEDVVIEFEDSGPGIEENIISKIFEPLFTTKQEGTGLGLATCKNLVNNHGGTIFVKNNPTTFTVILPRAA